MKDAFIHTARKAFHQALITDGIISVDVDDVASNADKDNPDSKAISAHILKAMGRPLIQKKLSGQSLGSKFEKACLVFVETTFPKLGHLRPGTWLVTHPRGKFKNGIAVTEQYAHLADLTEACLQLPQLAAMIGQDYLISPDIMILRDPEEDDVINSKGIMVDDSVARLASLRKRNGGKAIFHASISCKFTMRSDRAQNSRSEALNLIRNRKGRVPHVAVVTAEPLPSRLASLALGTGDLDFVYHIALPELRAAVDAIGSADSKECLNIMVDGKRLRDISDLPLDLAV